MAFAGAPLHCEARAEGVSQDVQRAGDREPRPTSRLLHPVLEHVLVDRLAVVLVQDARTTKMLVTGEG
jgi:hypothetical protein